MNDQAFMEELEQFKQQVQEETAQYVRGVVGMMLDQITDTNPLDTGKCTASWTASVGSPNYNEATDVVPLNRLSRAEAKSRSMGTLEGGLAGYQLGDTIYLSNGTNYVDKLEQQEGYVKTTDGHAQFVALTKSNFAPWVDSKINIP